MVVITCNIKADNGPTQYLEDVNLSWWDLQKEGQYTDVVLVSGQLQVRVHREILLRVSSFLLDLVPPSCSCETPAITLPKVRGDTLKALVELAYTGRSRVESRKGKEEFESLTELLQIGLEVQCEEIVSQDNAGHDHVIQVAPKDVMAADLVKINREKADAVERKNGEEKAAPTARKKTEEKAVAERKKPEEIADDEGNKYEDVNTASERRENEERAAEYKGKKNEKNTAVSKKRIGDGKHVSGVKADAETKKSEEKTTKMKYFAAENGNEEKKTTEEAINVLKPPSAERCPLVEKVSPVKVGRSLRKTRARGRKSTDQVTRAIPFLSPISPRRKSKSPDSIFAKTTRNQKRKIENILSVTDDINVMPEPKRKKAKLAIQIQPTKKSCKFVNIQDINADSFADIDLFGENDENENSNDFVQDPIKGAYLHNSIENPFENSDVSIFSDEEKSYVEKKEGWDKETASNIKEVMFVCPFCKKEFKMKSRYDHHLSWNHFQVEITDKFPGLECAVCTKRFVKKSNYVHHLGSFHKVIDGLMVRAFNAKMAQIREEEQGKPFTTPRPYRKCDSKMETPNQNIGAPKQYNGTPKQVTRTPKYIVGTPKQNIGTPKYSIGIPNLNIGTPMYSIGIPKQNIGTPAPNPDKENSSTPKRKSEKSGKELEESKDVSDTTKPSKICYKKNY